MNIVLMLGKSYKNISFTYKIISFLIKFVINTEITIIGSFSEVESGQKENYEKLIFNSVKFRLKIVILNNKKRVFLPLNYLFF